MAGGTKVGIRTLADAIARHAGTAPDKAAVVFLADGETEARRLGYAALHARVAAVGEALRARGLAGERALIMLPTGVEYVEAFLGCLYAGVLAVPVYAPTTSMHADRLARIIADSNAACVVTTRKIHDGLAGRFAKLLEPGAAEYFLLDEEAAGGGMVRFAPAPGEGIAYLQYTSGSTGDPRGVMITHENLTRYMDCWQRRFQHGPEDVFVSWVPLFHDMGLIQGLVQPLLLGATTVLMPPPAFLQRPARWLEAITRYHGTFSEGPNFAYELCCERIDEAQRAGLDLSSWRHAINGAEPIRASTMERFAATFAAVGFRREALNPGYGLAEATLGVTTTPPGRGTWAPRVDAEALRGNRLVPSARGDARPLVACGPELPGVTVAIVDPETRRPRPDGEIGELWVKGPIVAEGYWRRPQETAETFQARLADGDGPFLRTGDLAVRHEGELFIAGRLKDILIVNGQNHYPQDLEQAAAAAHPAVAASRAAAFPVEVGREERVVIAIEVRRSERKALEGDAVARAVRTAIVEQHGVRPYAVLLLRPATIQVTSSGKIQRRACKSAFLAGTLEPLHRWIDEDRAAPAASAAAPAAAPGRSADEIAGFLAERVARVARLEPAAVGRDRPFAEFGLDSVDVVELSGAVSDWLGRSVDPSEIFSYPSIAKLAAFLAAAVPAPAAKPAAAAPAAQAVAAPAPALAAASPGSAVAQPAPSSSPAAAREIAIVGMACRFPGAPSLDAYWKLLEGGVDAITEVPASRFRVDELYRPGGGPGMMSTRWGGFLEGVDRFDAAFFGVAPREAESMDPQQRLLLQTAWHALEDAGIPPPSLAGSSTGVFVGVATSDYRNVQWSQGAGRDAYSGTGTALSIAANRLSYVLDLHGPSWAVDTACSSSLVALHHARRSLLDGECDVAIVAGVNLILAPDWTVVFSQAQMMSPDGRCRTFDAGANGYVRGEGCGVLVLKRAEDARRDGARVAALLVGSAVNQDGRSNGLTAPNGLAQEAVMRRALASAGLAPSDVGYVEAHGTGTPLGDPIEVNALQAVYGEAAPGAPTLWVGSVKTNIGHLEAAAGVAGVIKAALSLQHGLVPAHLHLREMNPGIRLDGTRLAVPRRTMEWEPGAAPRVAGVSSFGFGGTNAHVLLRAAQPEAVRAPDGADSGPALLVLSARTAGSLRALTERWVAHLDDESAAGWASLCRSSRVHRAQLPHRLAIVSRRKGDAARALERHLAGEDVPEVFAGAAAPRGKVAFLFTGQGAQYPEMGYGLYRAHAGFRRALERCDGVVAPLLGESLLDVMFAPGGAERLATTEFAQPALFALEWSLYSVLEAAGLAPDVVIGHSLGEYVAACAAGVFSLEDGLRLVAHRGRLMQRKTRPGAMYAIGGPPEMIARVLQSAPDHAGAPLAVAAHNAPGEAVLSGDADALRPILEHLAGNGARVTPLHVSRAFHSPLMDDMLEEFARCAREVTYRAPRLPLVSNVTGELIEGGASNPDYWVRHVREPVRFAAGVEALVRHGCETMVEVGPHPVLTGFGRQIAPEARWLSTLRRNKDPREELDRCVAAWYASGRGVDFPELEAEQGAPPRPPAKLPAYPFEEERHWVAEGAPRLAASDGVAATAFPGREIAVPGQAGRAFQARLGAPALAYLRQHRVLETPVLPATGTIGLLAAAFRAASGAGAAAGCALEDVRILRPVVLPDDADAGEVVAHVACEPPQAPEGAMKLRAWAKAAGAEAWTEFASCTARASPAPVASAAFAPHAGTLEADGVEMLGADRAYARFVELGMQYGPAFRGLRTVRRRGDVAVAEVAIPRDADPGVRDGAPEPALLDACLHSLIAFVDPAATSPVVPVAVRRVELLRPLPEEVRVHVAWSGAGADADGRARADVTLSAPDGTCVARLVGLELAAASRESLAERLGRAPFEEYRLAWKPIELSTGPAKDAAAGPWVLFCEDPAELAAWRREAADGGVLAVGVTPGPRTRELGPELFELADEDEDEVLRFFEGLAARHRKVAGIVHLARARAEADGEVIADTYALARRHFAVLRGFLRVHAAAMPTVIVCSQGAVATGATGEGVILSQSVLTGLARALAAEFPSLACVQVDRDGSPEAPPLVEVLRCAVRGSGAVARRGGAWLGGELERGDRIGRAAAGGAPALRRDASYLVTGGTGGIGLAVAEWLIARGAGAVVLASRSGAVDPARLADLARSSARVEVAKLDLADPGACAALLRRIDAELPPLRGVFHAAGVLEDGAFAELAWPRIEPVLDAKVKGAWNLHRLTAGCELDQFVLFSSLASLLGSAGQGNYAAANAFLDALAHRRRASGLPALSVNWGPWAEVGMAARGGRLERLAGAGVSGLAPRHALAALGGALALDGAAPAQVGIGRIDWARYVAAAGRRVSDTLLSGLVARGGPPTAAPAEETSALDLAALAERPAPEAKALLVEDLLGRVARVLRFDARRREELRARFAAAPLNELGLDSLMAVELHNRLKADLGVEVPVHLFLGGSTPADLADYVHQQAVLRRALTAGPATDDTEHEVFTL